MEFRLDGSKKIEKLFSFAYELVSCFYVFCQMGPHDGSTAWPHHLRAID